MHNVERNGRSSDFEVKMHMMLLSFYSAAVLLAMQSAVIATATPSVGLYVRASVTRWYTIQTNEDRITGSSL